MSHERGIGDAQSRNVKHSNGVCQISLQRTGKTFKAGMFNITQMLPEYRWDEWDSRGAERPGSATVIAMIRNRLAAGAGAGVILENLER